MLLSVAHEGSEHSKKENIMAYAGNVNFFGKNRYILYLNSPMNYKRNQSSVPGVNKS